MFFDLFARICLLSIDWVKIPVVLKNYLSRKFALQCQLDGIDGNVNDNRKAAAAIHVYSGAGI